VAEIVKGEALMSREGLAINPSVLHRVVEGVSKGVLP
jgi:hypothetical protein